MAGRVTREVGVWKDAIARADTFAFAKISGDCDLISVCATIAGHRRQALHKREGGLFPGSLREGRERDHVGNQDRHLPAFSFLRWRR